MGLLDMINTNRTIRDFDFTMRAIYDINHVVSAEDFLDMDSEMIFQHLLSGMRPVSFKDYLKRYIYERAGMEEPFRRVPDMVFQEIIMDSFVDNQAPFSFTPTKKRKSAIIRGWLSSDTVRRNTVFALGFGLHMTKEDVSEFLTKVIREEDFVLTDPREVVYEYCYRMGYPYGYAAEFLEEYERTEADSLRMPERERRKWEEKLNKKELQIKKDSQLRMYLQYLKVENIVEHGEKAARQEFALLLEKTKQLIASMYNENYVEQKKVWKPEDISMADVEKVICSGIPINKSGNLVNMKGSKLSEQFKSQRMSRQRLTMISHGKQQVERFDLITLLFFVYSQEQEEELPDERCRAYIDEVNAILRQCNMMHIYPVNPYESFVLMCLLTDFPLMVYSDIWEMSYQEN